MKARKTYKRDQQKNRFQNQNPSHLGKERRWIGTNELRLEVALCSLLRCAIAGSVSGVIKRRYSDTDLKRRITN